MVRHLMGRGTDPNLVLGPAGDNQTALFVTVRKHTDTVNFENNLAVVSSLISHGADRCFGSTANPLFSSLKTRFIRVCLHSNLLDLRLVHMHPHLCDPHPLRKTAIASLELRTSAVFSHSSSRYSSVSLTLNGLISLSETSFTRSLS